MDVQETDVCVTLIVYIRHLLIDAGIDLPGCASTSICEIDNHRDIGRTAIGTNTCKIRAQDSFFILFILWCCFCCHKGPTVFFFFLTFRFFQLNDIDP